MSKRWPERTFSQGLSVHRWHIFYNTVFLISTLWSWFRYLAAMLVINWLSRHEDPILQRMAVAVISILVAKVKTLLAYCALACCREIVWHLLVAPHLHPLLHLCDTSWSFMLEFSPVKWANFFAIMALFVLVWHLEFKEALIFLFYLQLSTEETAQLSEDVSIMKVHSHLVFSFQLTQRPRLSTR